jgi:hypothetical protein
MSAPTLPVLRRWIESDGPQGPFVRAWEGATDTELPALAVPDALWQDDEFRAAVACRVHDLAAWDYPTTDEYLQAIHAELRARAGEDV